MATGLITESVTTTTPATCGGVTRKTLDQRVGVCSSTDTLDVAGMPRNCVRGASYAQFTRRLLGRAKQTCEGLFSAATSPVNGTHGSVGRSADTRALPGTHAPGPGRAGGPVPREPAHASRPHSSHDWFGPPRRSDRTAARAKPMPAEGVTYAQCTRSAWAATTRRAGPPFA